MNLSTYRYHPVAGQWRTKIKVVEYGGNWVKESDLLLPEKYREMSHEDCRLFQWKNELYASLVVAVFPGVPNTVIPCAQVYGRMVQTVSDWMLEDVVMPKYGNNNFQGQEKNWVFFDYGGKLHFIYQLHHEQVVVPLNGAEPEATYRTPTPRWDWGTMRGGTQPLPYQGKWLRFFHSLLQAGNKRQHWRYFISALVMDTKPPFAVERVSQKPIFAGNEKYTYGCKHWKPNVAIPYGAIEQSGGWRVSLGLNDCECAWLDLTEKELNL